MQFTILVTSHGLKFRLFAEVWTCWPLRLTLDVNGISTLVLAALKMTFENLNVKCLVSFQELSLCFTQDISQTVEGFQYEIVCCWSV